MREGAVGRLDLAPVSAGARTPRPRSSIALAAEAARLGGVYATHMRSEGAEIDAALDEAIRIGREARIPVEIWHLKVAGKRNWVFRPSVSSRFGLPTSSILVTTFFMSHGAMNWPFLTFTALPGPAGRLDQVGLPGQERRDLQQVAHLGDRPRPAGIS